MTVANGVMFDLVIKLNLEDLRRLTDEQRQSFLDGFNQMLEATKPAAEASEATNG